MNFSKSHCIIPQILTLKLYESLQKCYAKQHFFFLVIDATIASDNTLRFRKNILEII